MMCINREPIPEDDGSTDPISCWDFWIKPQRPNMPERLSEYQNADTKQQVWQQRSPISESETGSKTHLKSN